MDSTVRFDPPPGWPQVTPGELPNSDWRPDPSWPPSPPGWVFYRDSRNMAVSVPVGAWPGPMASQPRSRRLLIIGVVALTIVALMIAVFAFVRVQADRGLTKSQFRTLVMRQKLGGHLYIPSGPYDDVRPAPPAVPTNRPVACQEAARLAGAVVAIHWGNDSSVPLQAQLVLFENQSAAVGFRDAEADCAGQSGSEVVQHERRQIGAATVRRLVGDFGPNTQKVDTVVVGYRGVDASLACQGCSLDLDVFARAVIAEIDSSVE